MVLHKRNFSLKERIEKIIDVIESAFTPVIWVVDPTVEAGHYFKVQSLSEWLEGILWDAEAAIKGYYQYYQFED